ncbi:MAG: 5-(carboxyamino)imidazole ribonucleotide mutase [Gammaproteobacteria bacterium]|nr:5-(carboxyamino)imidazole ribonucleotide mutase [Gammaproteobacteria bacterium]
MRKAKVAVVMGSTSDWPVMQLATETLDQFGVEYEARVVSAHRTPDLLAEFGKTAADNGFACIIAGAGGAAHLPGMLAANSTIPVLGVPVPTEHLQGQDSLYSIVQMPKGIPVATFAIGKAGAINAALFAVSMLANNDSELARQLTDFRNRQRDTVLDMTLPPAE